MTNFLKIMRLIFIIMLSMSEVKSASKGDSDGEWIIVDSKGKGKSRSVAARPAISAEVHNLRPELISKTKTCRPSSQKSSIASSNISVGTTAQSQQSQRSSCSVFADTDSYVPDRWFKSMLLSVDPDPNNVVGPRVKHIEEFRGYLKDIKVGEKQYTPPLGQKSKEMIYKILSEVCDILQEKDVHIGVIVNCGKLVRHLDMLRIQDKHFCDCVAKNMARYDRGPSHSGKLLPFTVINAFLSMSKMMCAPDSFEFHQLVNDKIKTLEEKIKEKQNPHSKTFWKDEDGDHFEFSSDSELEEQDLLACVVIGYGMMSIEQLTEVEKFFKTTASPRHKALTILQSLPQEISAKTHSLFTSKILQLFYWCLLLDKQSKQKYKDYVKDFFTQQGLSENSRTEGRLLESLKKNDSLIKEYKLDHPGNPSGLYTEIDFVFSPFKENGKNEVVFFESDGPFHFVRQIDPAYKGPGTLTGQTYLKTKLLLQKGRVVRMSSLCGEEAYRERIEKMPSVVYKCASGGPRCVLVDPENYPVDFVKNIDVSFTANIDDKDAFPELSSITIDKKQKVPGTKKSKIKWVPL